MASSMVYDGTANVDDLKRVVDQVVDKKRLLREHQDFRDVDVVVNSMNEVATSYEVKAFKEAQEDDEMRKNNDFPNNCRDGVYDFVIKSSIRKESLIPTKKTCENNIDGNRKICSFDDLGSLLLIFVLFCNAKVPFSRYYLLLK